MKLRTRQTGFIIQNKLQRNNLNMISKRLIMFVLLTLRHRWSFYLKSQRNLRTPLFAHRRTSSPHSKFNAKPQAQLVAHKEGCYVKEIDDVVPFGTELKPFGYCYRINCGTTMIHYASCGTVGTNDPHCYATKIDPRKPYPECCPNIKCDTENDIDVES